jgi:hypothetical protein
MNPAHLFHASEEHDIATFHPRPPPSPEVGPYYDCVWTIEHNFLVNYIAPRDCPRVIFRRRGNTSDADAERLLGASNAAHIMTIERGWLERAQTTAITLYAFERGPHWQLFDANAGVYLARETVKPVARHLIPNPVAALATYGCELRIVDNLWPLIDDVVASTMRFSIIRKRNAQPRQAVRR